MLGITNGRQPQLDNTSVTLDRVFSPQDMDRIRRGVVPEAMEDKWFIYWKEDMLFFHRSWVCRG